MIEEQDRAYKESLEIDRKKVCDREEEVGGARWRWWREEEVGGGRGMKWREEVEEEEVGG